MFLIYICGRAVYWPEGSVSRDTAQALKFYEVLLWILSDACFIFSAVVFLWQVVHWLATKSVRVRGRILYTAFFCLGSYVSLCSPFLLRIDFVKTFTPVAERGQVLVDAVEAFHKDRNAYPESVKDLVPAYLKELPRTGLAGYPDFEYSKGDDKTPYMIHVSTSLGLMNWDEFIYRPNGGYEKQYGTECIEPVGKWVYFHE